MLVDIRAPLFAAAGRPICRERRPVGRRGSRISPNVLTSILGAVSDLVLVLTPEEEATVNAAACHGVLPLLSPGRC